MKKRIFAIALLLTLLLPLVGCNTVPAETTGNTLVPETTTTISATEQSTSIPPETEPGSNALPLYIDPEDTISFTVYPAVPEKYEVVVQRIPETVDNPDDLPVLKWVCLLPQDRASVWSDSVITEINQMLAEKNMPFRLQLVIAATKVEPTSMYDQLVNIDWTAIPETAELIAEADLLFGAFPGETGQQYLQPITEYVTGAAQPSLQNAVPHEKNWKTVTRDGEIYGIPADISAPQSNGWKIAPGMLEKWGLTEEDFQKNFWEMDETFAKIYEANGGPFLYLFESSGTEAFLYSGFMRSKTPLYPMLCSRYQFDVGAGFCLDLKGEQPTVNSILESEEIRLTQQACIRYQDAGYTKGYDSKNQPKVYFTSLRGTSPYTEDGTICIPVTESYYYPNFNGFLYLNGVAADTPYAAEAVQLLSLVAEDEVFRDYLCYGMENREYKEIEGYIQKIKNDEGSSYQATFLSPLSTYSSVLEGTAEQRYSRDGKTPLETYREDIENVTYWACPIVFDYTGYESELTELGGLLGTSYHYFLNAEQRIQKQVGTNQNAVIPRMDEAGYERVVEAAKAAGSDRILAALQAQLDAWLADHPDWSAKIS